MKQETQPKKTKKTKTQPAKTKQARTTRKKTEPIQEPVEVIEETQTKKAKVSKLEQAEKLARVKSGDIFIDNVKDKMPKLFSQRSKNNIEWLLNTLNSAGVAFRRKEDGQRVKFNKLYMNEIHEMFLDSKHILVFEKIPETCRVEDNRDYSNQRIVCLNEIYLKPLFAMGSNNAYEGYKITKSDIPEFLYLKYTKDGVAHCFNDDGSYHPCDIESAILIESGSIKEITHDDIQQEMQENKEQKASERKVKRGGNTKKVKKTRGKKG